MEKIFIHYNIVRDENLVLDDFAEVGLTKKHIKEIEEFIADGHNSAELVDIPGHIYDRILSAVQEDAIRKLDMQKDGLCEDDEIVHQKYIPVSLGALLSEDIVNSFPDELFEEPDWEEALAEEDEEDIEEDEEVEDEWPEPTKENTLYLPIKQVFFDQIVSGEKTEEYREIKDTTYKKYLEVDEEGNPMFYSELMNEGEMYDIDTYNGGVCALVPKQSIYYLNLAVGYAQERDTMIVQVTDFSFEPAKDKKGNPVIFDWDKVKGPVMNPNGAYTLWVIAFHLGEIVDLHRK